jgi:Transketolase, thiamine diphosphate binding domain
MSRSSVTSTAMSELGLDTVAELAAQLRVDSIRSSTSAGSGHPTSSMSAADLLAVLVARHLRFDWDDPKAPANDHLILSKGHASPLLYSVLRAVGVVSEDELMTRRQLPGSARPDRARLGPERVCPPGSGVRRPGARDRRTRPGGHRRRLRHGRRHQRWPGHGDRGQDRERPRLLRGRAMRSGDHPGTSTSSAAARGATPPCAARGRPRRPPPAGRAHAAAVRHQGDHRWGERADAVAAPERGAARPVPPQRPMC